MKRLLRFSSVFALLLYFVPFLRYQVTFLREPVIMNFFDIWFGMDFSPTRVAYTTGVSLNATLAIAFALAAVASAWLLDVNKWSLRISVLAFSVGSLIFFTRITQVDFAADAPAVIALNNMVKNGIEFKTSIAFALSIAFMALNAIICLTTDNFAANIVKYKWWYLMLVPAIVFLLLFVYIPMSGLALMFVDLNINDMFKSTFVGLKWFRMLWANIDGEFGQVLANTVIIAVIKLIVNFPAPIILAILINECRQKVYKRVVQTVSYLPNFISWSIIGGLIITLFNSEYSVVNGVRKMMDEGAKGFYLLNEVALIRTTLVLSTMWKNVGWSSIIYIASLTTVNPELYESARLDGAGKLKQIWHITLPGISAMIVLKFIFEMPSLLQDNMDQALNLVLPLTVSKGKTLSLYVYEIGIKNRGKMGMAGNYSFAATIGFCNQILAFCLLLIGNSLGRRVNPDGAVW